MIGVRFREDTGFEGRCEECRGWWPMDSEFWLLTKGLRRCRACQNEAKAESDRNRRPRPMRSAAAIARRKESDRERKRLERIDPERRPILLARQRESQARFYERRRAEVLAGHRARYAERVGHEPTPGIGRPRAAA